MKKNMAFEPTLIIKSEGNQNIDATLILNNNYPNSNVQNPVQEKKLLVDSESEEDPPSPVFNRNGRKPISDSLQDDDIMD